MKRTACQNISPYLVTDANAIVEPRNKALNAPLPMVYGSCIYSGGHLLLTESDRDELLAENEDNGRFIRQCIGGDEILNGRKRWCLWLYGCGNGWRESAYICRRVQLCRQYRLSAAKSRAYADEPWEFGELRQPESGMILALPKVSSENRRCLPMAYVDHCVVVNASALTVPNAGLVHFGILSSAMHMAWLSAVGGKYSLTWQYGCRSVYNTFPWPSLDDASEVEDLAELILKTREMHPDMNLGDMCGLERMPADLKRIHAKLDIEVDRLYTPKNLSGTEERLKCLFAEYDRLVQNKDRSIDQWC